MPLQATSGAASYDAFGGGVPVVPAYIEEVFSTYLLTGTGASQTITNGIDLSTKGGLVWLKRRDGTVSSHQLYDTNRGVLNILSTNSTNAQSYSPSTLTDFNTDGFTVGSSIVASGATMASWTFRKQPKFFDVLTYTGDGTSTRQISHSLASTPGCIIIKPTNISDAWYVWQRTLGNNGLLLNSTDAQNTYTFVSSVKNSNSTQMTVGDGGINDSGTTYVAYLFAHNAGGFGLTGTDNVISCGSFTTDAFGDPTTVNLGYEPQWVLLKSATSAASWFILDTMRGWTNSPTSKSMTLLPNTSGAEAFGTVGADNLGSPTATGFTIKGVNAADTMIYIAIRRGPMKVPTVGTSVFSPTFTSVSTSPLTVTTNFPVDLTISRWTTVMGNYVIDRLRGASDTLDKYLFTNATDAEANISGLSMQSNTAVIDSGFLSGGSNPKIFWNFRRAPSFFDEVCYTGTGSATTQTHNLGVAPELIFFKARNGGTADWRVYVSPSTNLLLNTTDSIQTDTVMWNNTAPTASVFSLGNRADVNESARNYVSYLFATCAGVSKVGSYTGNGSSQTINCGFTGGARFVLIKKTSGTGDWMVSDSARGIVSGNDPYLELNNTNAEVTGEDWLDTDSTGFVVNEVSGSNANTSSATYIFLAVS